MKDYFSLPHSAKMHGNVLFIILIAVALFAALSYAITSSSRSTGPKPDQEKLELVASTVLNYGATIKSAIMRMKLSDSCTNEQISFETPLHWYNYANSNAPSSKKCHVFNTAGGNVSFMQVDKLLAQLCQNGSLDCAGATEHFFGLDSIPQIGTDCGTPSCSDMYLGIQVPGPSAKAFCQAFNKKLQIDNAPSLGSNALWFWPPFTGTYTNPNTAIDASLNGQHAMCYTTTATPPVAAIYYVLIAR